MDAVADRVRRLVGVEHKHTTPHPAQHQRRGQSSRTAAHDRDLEVSIRGRLHRRQQLQFVERS
jgi:hypothetical protein